MDIAVTSLDAARLQSGAALRVDDIVAMRPAWRFLAQSSELPTTQYEWTFAGIELLKRNICPRIAYVSDGSSLRAILPLMLKRHHGVDHLHLLTPPIPLPSDILHADRPALEALWRSVLKQGKPVVLARLLESSPAAEYLRTLSQQHKIFTLVEKGESVLRLQVNDVSVQDRSQSSARVSILAASYGLSGGPNDVIFQFASPSLEQVMSLYHELLQLEGSAGKEGGSPKSYSPELDSGEFLRAHAFNGVQRGEIRFSCLRLGERLLAAQMFQLRTQTAWLLKTAYLERFQGTLLDALLLGETVKKLKEEGIEQVVMPASAVIKEMGKSQEIKTLNLRIYPWSSRSLGALMVKQAGTLAGRLLRRRGSGRGRETVGPG